MAYNKAPTYLWQHPDSGLYFFKLGIPTKVRRFFPSETPGKVKSHIVESLETHSRVEAQRHVPARLIKYRAEFLRLEGKAVMPAPKRGQALVSQVRAALVELNAERDGGEVEDDDNHEAATAYLYDQAEQAHAMVEREEGGKAAALALRTLRAPELPTIREALEAYLAASVVTQQYRDSYRLAVNELLAFLGSKDGHAQDITGRQSLAFVDSLNSGPLSLGAKKKRLSNLNMLWKHTRHRGWPPSPWRDHILKGAPRPISRDAGDGGEDDPDEVEDVRPFTDEEARRIFTLPPPSDKRQRTYTRPLFRELYALGFTTGMRLNEIVTLRPVDVRAVGDWRVLTVRRAVVKNGASARILPVCHPVALAIIDSRVKAQADQKARIFSECATGGPDKKPSWHVSKAMGRERLDVKRLNFTSEVNFHSTRRSFGTLMENSECMDSIGQQRYMGHTIPTELHKTYSGGPGLKKLQGVVEGLRYSDEVEQALRLALP